jgi:hypothetical protein
MEHVTFVGWVEVRKPTYLSAACQTEILPQGIDKKDDKA